MVKSTSTRTTITEAAGAPRLGLRAAIDSWRLSLRAANRSPATIKTYLDAATRFESFVAERGMPGSLEGIRREHVEAFLVSLQDAGSAPGDGLARLPLPPGVLEVGGRRRTRSASRRWPG